MFTKDQKGDLLRKLFELETKSVPKRAEPAEVKKQVVWSRRFDNDDVIII